MKQDQVMALVKAHNMRDEDRFRRTVLQIAAQAKSPFKEELQAQAQLRLLAPLPHGSQGFLSEVSPVDLADLLLDEPTQSLLAEVAEELQYASGLRDRGIRPRTRLLFCGPPGNGKTSTAAALAGLLKLTPYEVNLANLVDSFQGATARNMTKVFEALALGHMVILNELDSVGNERSSEGAADNQPGDSRKAARFHTRRTEADCLQGGAKPRDARQTDAVRGQTGNDRSGAGRRLFEGRDARLLRKGHLLKLTRRNLLALAAAAPVAAALPELPAARLPYVPSWKVLMGRYQAMLEIHNQQAMAALQSSLIASIKMRDLGTVSR